MASNYEEIEKAIIAAYLEVDSTTPTGMPGRPLLPDAKGPGLWATIHNVRGQSGVATLGAAGTDNHPGFIQIDLNYPEGKGSGPLLTKADALASAFPAGRALAYNGQEVKVLGTSLGPGRYVGGFYRVSLTINYYARTQRNI